MNHDIITEYTFFFIMVNIVVGERNLLALIRLCKLDESYPIPFTLSDQNIK